MEKQEGITISHSRRPSVSPRHVVRVAGAVVAIFLLALLNFRDAFPSTGQKLSVVDRVQKCAIKNLHNDLSFLDSAKPIAADEFIERRDRLARALAASAIDAFVVEPGYTFAYDTRASTLLDGPRRADRPPGIMATSRRRTGSRGSLRRGPS